jgi:predicted amidohydrolase YtcJ
VRGTGYDEAVAGELTGARLDALSTNVPTRVQHRSGAMWVVNRAGSLALGLDDADVDGIERGPDGLANGRLWRLDGWLRNRWGQDDPPNLSRRGSRLASLGVTGVTDASPDLTPDTVAMLAAADLPQRLVLLGAAQAVPGLELGPLKIVVADSALPGSAELAERIRASRPRAVAVHSVTRESLLLTLSVLEQIGAVRGDRIEHAAVAPSEAVEWIARLGVTVITQPSLPARRGGDYLDRVDAGDRDHLWPFRSLLDAGVPVGCSSDAPYGELDPWASIAAAVERRTPSGRAVAGAERVDACSALRGYLSSPHDPGGPACVLAAGARADLALLDRPLADALAKPADVHVVATVAGGQLVFSDLG